MATNNGYYVARYDWRSLMVQVKHRVKPVIMSRHLRHGMFAGFTWWITKLVNQYRRSRSNACNFRYSFCFDVKEDRTWYAAKLICWQWFNEQTGIRMGYAVQAENPVAARRTLITKDTTIAWQSLTECPEVFAGAPIENAVTRRREEWLLWPRLSNSLRLTTLGIEITRASSLCTLAASYGKPPALGDRYRVGKLSSW